MTPKAGPFALAVGDLNGDGILDIVTGNPQIDILGGVPGTTISVLWGNGDGTFRPHVDYQASGPPMFVAVGDLNGDRKNDVAVALANSSTVTPLLNTGSGPGDVLSVNAQTPSPLTPSVLLMPGATNCTACGVAFVPGAAVTLTPEPPGDGTTLSEWTGSCSGSGTCGVNMTGDKSVTANFVSDTSTFALTVNMNGSGSGAPLAEQPYVSCTAFYCAPSLVCTGNACSANYPTGNVVVIGAVPDPVSTFAGWSGVGCYANQIDCTVTMNSAVTVTANFNRIPGLQKLTVVVSGSGNPLITSDPAGINCSGGSTACSAAFATGTSVTLTPSPLGIGETFNWSGSGCSGSGTCTVILKSDQTVTAMTTDSPDFGIQIYPQLSPNPISAGQSASGGVQLVQGDQNFSATINLTCSVQPATQFAPTCALDPSSSTVWGPVTVTVTTSGPQSAALRHHQGPLRGGFYAIWLSVPSLLLMSFWIRRSSSRQRFLHSVYADCAVLILVGLAVSCGGENSGSRDGNTRTPPGNLHHHLDGNCRFSTALDQYVFDRAMISARYR
jgi:Divergent InlB B-repeat domain/FG-GAP-like repeat